MSRSEYYRPKAKVDSEEKKIEKQVIHCFKKNHANYGRIRIKKSLKRKGINISESKISRILKKNGLQAKSERNRKKRKSTLPEQQYIEENLVKNQFEITLPNYLWCSDITELKCKNYKVYLCGVIDVATSSLLIVPHSLYNTFASSRSSSSALTKSSIQYSVS